MAATLVPYRESPGPLHHFAQQSHLDISIHGTSIMDTCISLADTDMKNCMQTCAVMDVYKSVKNFCCP